MVGQQIAISVCPSHLLNPSSVRSYLEIPYATLIGLQCRSFVRNYHERSFGFRLTMKSPLSVLSYRGT